MANWIAALRNGNGVIDVSSGTHIGTAEVNGQEEILIFGFVCVAMIVLTFVFSEARQSNDAPRGGESSPRTSSPVVDATTASSHVAS